MTGGGGPDVVHLTAREVEQARLWCNVLPGWKRGPAHAPHPLVFETPDE